MKNFPIKNIGRLAKPILMKHELIERSRRDLLGGCKLKMYAVYNEMSESTARIDSGTNDELISTCDVSRKINKMTQF